MCGGAAVPGGISVERGHYGTVRRRKGAAARWNRRRGLQLPSSSEAMVHGEVGFARCSVRPRIDGDVRQIQADGRPRRQRANRAPTWVQLSDVGQSKAKVSYLYDL
ncbi:unnamed protein product [Urochloa humidicola]